MVQLKHQIKTLVSHSFAIYLNLENYISGSSNKVSNVQKIAIRGPQNFGAYTVTSEYHLCAKGILLKYNHVCVSAHHPAQYVIWMTWHMFL